MPHCALMTVWFLILLSETIVVGGPPFFELTDTTQHVQVVRLSDSLCPVGLRVDIHRQHVESDDEISAVRQKQDDVCA